MLKNLPKKTWFWVALLLLLSIFSFKSLFQPGYFFMHDDMQPIRVLQIDKCFKDGQIPCRWVPDLGYGYGYPLYLYYPPLAYYLMEGFHLLGFSFLTAVKLEFALTFILSGLAMFLLGKSLWGNFGGLISALFYVYAPYRASDVYTRGAVGEFTALIFLPLILWTILEFVRQEKIKYLIFLALSYGGLLITHNITSFIFTAVAALWGLFLLWHQQKWKLLPRLLLGAILGVGLAGFFILPVIFEKKLVHVETMTYGYFNYLAHFTSLRQLFFKTHWGYGSSELGPDDDLSFAIGTFHWLFALLVWLIAWKQKKKEGFSFLTLSLLGLAGVAAAFMTHQRSVFIWNRLAFLRYLQFPWRFLTIVTFAFSAMAGAAIFYLKKYKLLVAILMVIGVILLNAGYCQPWIRYDITDKEKFSGELWEKQLTASIFDYLPIYAEAPPAEKAPEIPWLVKGEGKVFAFEKGTNWQKGRVEIVSDQAQIRLPLFYFPKFELKVDGEKTPIDYQNELGLVSFNVDRGSHKFDVKLRRTPVRVVGDLMTLVSLLAIGGWLIYEKKNA